jgi:hypothetical protein
MRQRGVGSAIVRCSAALLMITATFVLPTPVAAHSPAPRSHYVFKGSGIQGVVHVARSRRRLIDYSIIFVQAPCPKPFGPLRTNWTWDTTSTGKPTTIDASGHLAYHEVVLRPGGGITFEARLEMWFGKRGGLRGWAWFWSPLADETCRLDGVRLVGHRVTRIPAVYL